MSSRTTANLDMASESKQSSPKEIPISDKLVITINSDGHNLREWSSSPRQPRIQQPFGPFRNSSIPYHTRPLPLNTRHPIMELVNDSTPLTNLNDNSNLLPSMSKADDYAKPSGWLTDSPVLTSASTSGPAHQHTMTGHDLSSMTTTLPYQSPLLSIPIRLPSQTQALAALDAELGSPHTLLDESALSSPDSEAATIALEEHIKNRQPYVTIASARLQAATGMLNSHVFDIPEAAMSAKPQARFSVGDKGGGLDAGRTLRALARGGGLKKNRPPNIGSLSTSGMHEINHETGKGLRAFLLQKGNELGMKQTELKSITFHDFAPDMRTKAFRNELLGHYAANEAGERCHMYEIDLPKMRVPEDGDKKPAAERWIWFLISRPLVTFDYRDASAVSPTSSGAQGYPKPPPNFPQPVPSSWLVFAAPLSNVTEYPEITERVDNSLLRTASYDSPGAKKAKLATSKIGKRRDFDFSHSGIPLFEFNTADDFPFSTTPALTFLSIENIAGWQANDAYKVRTTEEYAELRENWHAKGGDGLDSKGQARLDSEGSKELPSPFRGTWWEEFFRKMYDDNRRWGNIKTAMAKGKCRIIARWEDCLEPMGSVEEYWPKKKSMPIALAKRNAPPRSETTRVRSTLAGSGYMGQQHHIRSPRAYPMLIHSHIASESASLPRKKGNANLARLQVAEGDKKKDSELRTNMK